LEFCTSRKQYFVSFSCRFSPVATSKKIRVPASFLLLINGTGNLMSFILYLVIILIAAVIIIPVAWRFASRRYTIPCPVWMKGMLDSPHSGEMSERTQKTIRHLDLRPGMEVLDVGCGPGRLTIPIAHAVGPKGAVTAIDIQEGMLGEARSRSRSASLTNIRFLQIGAGEGKLEHNRFDRAVMVTVLGEIPKREAALDDIFLALKPGGFLVIEETIRDPHFQTRGTVRKLAAVAGFIEKEFSGSRFSYTISLEKPSGV
jgi:SAM-dependent methyltransferase